MVRLPRWAMVASAALFSAALVFPVYAQPGSFQGEVVGKVKSISADQHQMTVRDADNRDWTSTINDATRVQVQNRQSKFGDLKVGECVDVVYSMDGFVPKTIQTLPKDKPIR